MNDSKERAELFKTKAEAVSAVVRFVKSRQEALADCVEICEQKEACKLLLPGCEAGLSADAAALCQAKRDKIIAAPGLEAADLAVLSKRCQDRGIAVVTSGLRDHLAGVDLGLTMADYGVAATGSLVIDSRGEELRLATMVSEIHAALLPASRIAATAADLLPELNAILAESPGYLAFVSGASRTADIERVLAIGVHGPLELRIYILEDE